MTTRIDIALRFENPSPLEGEGFHVRLKFPSPLEGEGQGGG